MGPVEQARQWAGQLIGVLMRRETVARVEKGRRGARRLLKPGGEKGEKNGGSGRGGATRRGGGVGPGPDRRAAHRSRPGRLRPGRDARGWHVSVSDRGAPRQLTGEPRS
jgi:hypothetical protein